MTCLDPLVNFQISQVSIVPKANLPSLTISLRLGLFSKIHLIFVAEKYGSIKSPVLLWKIVSNFLF